MDKSTNNLNGNKRIKKSQKQVNRTFRDKHQLIQLTFSKIPDPKKGNGLSEYEILMKNASNYSKSLARFIRDCSLEPRIKVIEKPPLVNEKMLLEVQKIGVNINQMAYKINAKVDRNELPEFRKTLAESYQAMDKILAIIRSK